ncbi:MAG: methylated-DNA--[protein]-cysteine S-methyltransferase [Candidatus Aminicenantes bacterium]
MKELVLNRAFLDTPYGQMVAMASKKGLAALEFVKPNRREMLTKRLNKWFPGCKIVDTDDDIIKKTRDWLNNYFSREFHRLGAPPLDMRGTEFELKVWQALQRIPLGQTISYQQLATRVGIPQGARAVGSANRRNPVSIIVPCHRVIGQNGSLVGYGGGLEVKEALIAHEIRR